MTNLSLITNKTDTTPSSPTQITGSDIMVLKAACNELQLLTAQIPGLSPYTALAGLEWDMVTGTKKTYTISADTNLTVINYAVNPLCAVLNLTKQVGITHDVAFQINGQTYPINQTPGGTTAVVLTYDGDALSIATDYDYAPGQPYFTQQPQDSDLLQGSGEPAIFRTMFKNAVASQWQKSGVDIAGQQGDILIIATPAAADIAGYRNKLTGTNGLPVFSDEALLNIRVPQAAAIAGQPQSGTVALGNNITLTVIAAGYPAPTIQWQTRLAGNGSFANISGATTATLQALTDYSRDYQAIVANATGTATTATATVTITKPAQPAPNPVAAYNDTADTLTLGALHTGKQWGDLRVIIGTDAPLIPTTATINVGEREIAANAVRVYYVETLTESQSPFVYNTQAFNNGFNYSPVTFSSLKNATAAPGSISYTSGGVQCGGIGNELFKNALKFRLGSDLALSSAVVLMLTDQNDDSYNWGVLPSDGGVNNIASVFNSGSTLIFPQVSDTMSNGNVYSGTASALQYIRLLKTGSDVSVQISTDDINYVNIHTYADVLDGLSNIYIKVVFANPQIGQTMVGIMVA